MSARRSASREPMNEREERLLVEAARDDLSQFGPLYERNFERVYAFIVRRVEDRAAGRVSKRL